MHDARGCLARMLGDVGSCWQGAGKWFRKGAGAVIGLLGIYFISSPFISAV